MAFIQKNKSRVVNALSTYGKKRRMMRELYSLSDRELEDIGIHRAQIQAVVRNAAF